MRQSDVIERESFGKHLSLHFQDSVHVDMFIKDALSVPGVLGAQGPFIVHTGYSHPIKVLNDSSNSDP